MEIVKTDLEGVLVIKPTVFGDGRGYFFESFRQDQYNFTTKTFVQHNISKSVRNVVRGLHYQVGDFAQGKLCQVIYGTAIDIAVDIRFGSPTFGKYVGVELSEGNKYQLWIPPGFAHGFAALSDVVIFNYKCTEYYSRQHERVILYNDPDLNIDWVVKNPIVSDKDLQGTRLKDINKDFFYEHSSIVR